MIFKENMVFQLKNEKYRIVGDDIKRGNIFYIELTEKARWNQVISLQGLESLCENNEAVIVDKDDSINIKKYDISEEMLKKRDFYYEIICFTKK